MRNKKNEKLDQLLRQFMDESQVREMENNLSFSDRLFSESPIPAIKPKTLISIQSTVHQKIQHQKYLAFGKQLAVVAAIVATALLAGLHILFPESPATYPGAHSAQTDNIDPLWNDVLYAASLNADPIMTELADLTESIHSVGEETYEPRDTFLDDLLELEEIESLAVNTDFWKG